MRRNGRNPRLSRPRTAWPRGNGAGLRAPASDGELKPDRAKPPSEQATHGVAPRERSRAEGPGE